MHGVSKVAIKSTLSQSRTYLLVYLMHDDGPEL